MAPSQPGQGGTPFAGRAGRKPAAFSLQLESRESEGKQSIPIHAPHVRHSGALMASIPQCGVAWLLPGRDMMKAESGRKLQPRCQMSTQGLQQAGSSNTA